MGAGTDPRSRRDLRFSLRRLDEQREDLAILEQTQTESATDITTAQIDAQAELAAAGLRRPSAGGSGGAAAAQGASLGDKALNSFRDTLLNTLPPTAEGEPDTETANQITAATRAAVTQQARLLREAGRTEDAELLERQGVGSFSETQKQGLVIGNKVRDRFLDKASDFFVSGTRGIDTGNPADFVPVGIDPDDPDRVLLAGDGLSMSLKDLERVRVTNTLGLFPGFFGSPRRTTELLQGLR